MSSAIWKYDGDAIFATNRLPARGIVRQINESAGSWVVAYATEQHNKFKASFKPKEFAKIQPAPGENESVLSQSGYSDEDKRKQESTVLTAKFLMLRHQVEKAEDLCSVDASDRNLDDVKEEELREFENVAYVNAAENLLPFRPFNGFPNLRELELPVNGLRNLRVKFGDFPHLQVLDLSYNNLSADDVLALGLLPKLKALTLTGNGLHTLHPDMARPVLLTMKSGLAEFVSRFAQLEVLLLDDNRLSDLSVFASLAALAQLRELNLDKNQIEVIPHLRVVGNRMVSEVHSTIGTHKSAPSSGRRSNASHRSWKAERSTSREELASKRNQATSTTLPQSSHADEFSPIKTAGAPPPPHPTADKFLTPELPGDVAKHNPPFRNLRLLSLANNRITEEEYVLAASAWPMLKHLVLHGNPIVKTTSGAPPLVEHYLNRRLGINVHRFVPKQPVTKPPLVVPDDRDRKVSSKVPKIPKQPIDALIQSLRLQPLPHIQPHPPPPRDSPAAPPPPTTLDAETADRKGADEAETADEGFFMTQVDEPGRRLDEDTTHKESVDATLTESAPETASIVKSPHPPPVVPEKFRGYEALMDARPDSSLHEPMGIQGNVRALHNLLDHPTVFRSAAATLDRRLPTYQQQPSKLGSAMEVARARHHRRVPDRKYKFGQLLDELKSRRQQTIEFSLAQVLNNKSRDITLEEADDLLVEVEQKYKVVRDASMRETREAQQAEKVLSDALHKMQSIA